MERKNKVHLVSAVFKDMYADCQGYRMFDDYDDFRFALPDDRDNKAPATLETLEKIWDIYGVDVDDVVADADNIVAGMFRYLIDCQQGIEIDGEWYEWDEIKYIFA